MIRAAMFDTKPYDRESFEKTKPADMEITYFDTKLDPKTVELARGFDTVIVFVNDELSKEVIEKLYAYGVRLIALRCAGFNNVDVKAAYKKIHVVRVPAYSPEAVAEHAMAMLLTSVRRIHKAYNRTREFNFSINGLVGFNLHDKTVGVVGMGKIGKAFARICLGFGMKVIAYDKYPSEIPGVEFMSQDEVLKNSDIISLHCPLTEDNHHLINKDSIARMKKGVVIINTSRGGLIDAEDLLEGIKSRQVGAACLDVYEEESDLFFDDRSGHILQDDILARLLSMPNVILTSHQAFLTREALEAIADTTLKNIKGFFEGEDVLPNEVCYKCEKVAECKGAGRKKCF
ncbi:MAG: 2-hydroxyacid dehydrogenase [Lachnospiraceae bacterium]|nr:2-hydroxyacid dehydrogenase [Lachnospiraceae bacterium]